MLDPCTPTVINMPKLKLDMLHLMHLLLANTSYKHAVAVADEFPDDQIDDAIFVIRCFD